MLLAHRWRPRPVARSRVAAIALGLCVLFPAAASAHRRARLESGVNEEVAAGAIQESTTSPPAGGETPTESSAGPRGERSSRAERREERRARRQARTGVGCSVDLEATPRIITAGATPSLGGTLSCPEAASAANQTVSLYEKLAGTPGFTVAATTGTEASGAFQFAPSGLEVNSVFFVRADGARSMRTRVEVAPAVTIGAPAAGTPLFTGGGPRAASAGTLDASSVTFTGSVSPTDAGAGVALERQFHAGGWQRIGLGRVDDEGAYSIPHTFTRAGETDIRVVVHSHGLYITSASRTVTYLISRRRSRPVTIQASVDPLAYGSSVTITGSVAGAEDAPVTLFGQTAGGTIVAIADAAADGEEYSFTESPLQSTRYRVASASASSATLSVLVTYALAPTPSPPTVKAGEQVTFTGTAAPAEEGQPVALERQNLSGDHAYHVIALGSVSSSSAYAIAYTFPTAADELLRISVPSDGAIEGVASEPFELEVTPAS